MHRQLNPAQRGQLVDQYRGGKSTYELARQYGIHRSTVAQHLRREGIVIPQQLKMTPDVVKQAKRLYASGCSVATVGQQLGVDATTVHKALKKAGVRMRDTHGRPT